LAFEGDGNIKPVSGDTIADSISVSLPRDGMAAVMALKESKGFAISLSDSEIVKAISEFSRKTGVFPEPAAASTYAAFLKAIKENKIDKSESVLLLITGNGLKDVQTAMKSVARKPYLIKPELNELKKIVGELVNQI
jgi:threonine synthase